MTDSTTPEQSKATACVGCGKQATGMCWTDCGMSLCGAPICDDCHHVDEPFGWSHAPRPASSKGG